MLLRINENVEIDMSYITCAEYQLFIDEKLQAGEYHQPDHWRTYRFPTGYAKKPITGVRASDAQAFCKWLTRQHSTLGFRYRLPTFTEAEEHPVAERQVGCWCQDGKQLILTGIETQQIRFWQQQLAEVLILKHDLNRVLNSDLYRVLNSDLNSNLNRDLNRDLNRVLNKDLYGILDPGLNRDLYLVFKSDLYRVLYRVLNSDLYRVFNRDLNRNLYRDLNRDLNRILNPALNSDLYRNLYRNLNHILYRILNSNLNSDLNRDLNSDLYREIYNKIESGKVSDFLILYFPLMFFIAIFHILFSTFSILSKNKEGLKEFGLTHQECEAISRYYEEKINNIFQTYICLVLLDERQEGRIPAWEGIRIVRERI